MTNDDQIHKRLMDMADGQRLAHGFLFVGSDSDRMLNVIRRFSAALFCRGEKENNIHQKKIQNGSHPDFFIVKTDKKEIKIEQIREFQRWMMIPPNDAHRKVGIIEQADLLNPSSANALLKLLEEPPAHALLFLVCRSAENLLSTIRSRLQVYRFASFSEESENALEEQFHNAFWYDDFQDILRKGKNCRPGDLFSFSESIAKKREELRLFLGYFQKNIKTSIFKMHEANETENRIQKMESIFDLAIQTERQTVQRYGNAQLGLDRLLLRWLEVEK